MFSVTFSPLLQWKFYSDVMWFFRPCCCTQPTQAATKQSIHTVSGGALTLTLARARTHACTPTHTHTHSQPLLHTSCCFSLLAYPQLRDRNQLRGVEGGESYEQKDSHKWGLKSPKIKTPTPLSTTELLRRCDSRCSRWLEKKMPGEN